MNESARWDRFNQVAIQCEECKDFFDPSHLTIVTDTLITCDNCSKGIHEFMADVAGHHANEHMNDHLYDDGTDNCEILVFIFE